MIPEGLALLTSVSLAVSAVRLAQKEVLLHNMKSIETLARVDVLCVDKTGTITEPVMKVAGMKTAVQGMSAEAMKNELSDFVRNMTKDNDTMKAMQQYFRTGTGKAAKKIQSFSSKYKYSGIEFEDGTYVFGAPEFVLREDYATYKKEIEAEAAKGYRVLVYGKYQGTLDGEALKGKVIPRGIVLLENPVREGAKKTFKYFEAQGVKTMVISGDNPLTVSETAKKAGITDADNCIDARSLQSKKDIYEAVQKYTVFGRVVPEQKKLIVKALQAQGHTVAMTGDGVNDILALREADCSVALGSGSDAASHVAQLVLLDSDFTRMPSVVAEGRRVVNNIQRTAALYLVKNIFSLLLSVFSVIMFLDYPLEPSQVTLISLFTIGLPSLILALEPNHERIKGHFMTNVLLKALPAGLTDFGVVFGLIIFCREFNVDTECLSTSVTILVAVVGFMIIYVITKPMQKHHWVMLGCLFGGWLFCMIFISHWFAITRINLQCAMLMVLFLLTTEPILRYLTKLFNWILDRIQKRSDAKRSNMNRINMERT
jgi:cation-transporting ATPase E